LTRPCKKTARPNIKESTLSKRRRLLVRSSKNNSMV